MVRRLARNTQRYRHCRGATGHRRTRPRSAHRYRPAKRLRSRLTPGLPQQRSPEDHPQSPSRRRRQLARAAVHASAKSGRHTAVALDPELSLKSYLIVNELTEFTPPLLPEIRPPLTAVEARWDGSKEAVTRDYTETLYAADSWTSQRRVVARIEVTYKGLDTATLSPTSAAAPRSGSTTASTARAAKQRI